MELSSKQLHKHAAPVVIVLAVLLIVSIGAGHDLFKRVIKVQPSPNGLAQVTVEKTASPQLNEAAQAGRSASLSIDLH